MPPFVQGFNPPNASISGNPIYMGGRDVNQSIVGLQLDSTGNINVGGSVLAFQGGIHITSISGTPNVNTAGSVVAFQGAGWSGSVAAIVTNTNVNIGGSVVAFQGGTQISSISGGIQGQAAPLTSIIGNPLYVSGRNQDGSVATLYITSSLLQVVGSVSGSVGIVGNPSISGTVNIGNTNVNVSGSVVAFQGTSPWIETFSNSSLFSAQQGTWRVSVAGGYTAGQASVVSAVGLLNLAVRNDTMASTLSADAQYSPLVVGPVGEIITANAPITKWISGTQSVLGPGQFGPSVIVLAAAGAGTYNYITGLQIANFSAPSVLVTLYSATDSILGKLVAPSGGTVVQIYYPNPIKTLANAAFTASIQGTNSSIFLSAQGFKGTT